MARPKKQRRVCAAPEFCTFRPDGRPEAEQIVLTIDEYEVLRLIDLEHMTQEQCAAQMQVARTTVTGIYDSARNKMAQMLVFGLGLTVSGGDVDVCGNAGTCCGKCGIGQCHCDNPSCTRKAAGG